MLRRLLHCLLIIPVGIFAYAKGVAYFRDVRLGLAGTPDGILQLLTLLLMVIAILIALRTVLGRRPSGTPAVQSRSREDSFPESLNRVYAATRDGLARRPLVTSLQIAAMAVVLGAIPVALVAMAHPGGIETFGARDWILVGIAVLPLMIVTLALLMRFKHGSNPDR